jgi:cytochrome P450
MSAGGAAGPAGLGLVDPTSPGYWNDIHGTLAPLREAGCVVRSTAGDYEVLRFDAVERGLRDPRMRQALDRMLAQQGIASGPLHAWFQQLMNRHDPPSHTRLRALVARAFTPRQVSRVRGRIREIAHALLDELAAQHEVDLVPTFCHRLPLAVLCEMLGVAEQDHARFDRWTTVVSRAFTAVLPDAMRAEIEAALVPFDAAVAELIERRRARPQDDLLDALIHVEEAGERLSSTELRALVINLLFAGHDTTKSLLANALWTLMSHPEQLARLRADASLVVPAVEEIARFEPPISGIPRIASEDLEIDGVPIAAGSYVTFSVPAANRDPRRFRDPDRFDVARADVRHFTFGHGIHHCVGASVARAEVQEALGVLVARGARLEPLLSRPRWPSFIAARRPESLPVRLSVRPR